MDSYWLNKRDLQMERVLERRIRELQMDEDWIIKDLLKFAVYIWGPRTGFVRMKGLELKEIGGGKTGNGLDDLGRERNLRST